MKPLGLSCITAALALASCQKPVTDGNENSAPQSVVIATTPAPPQFAPPGVYYVLTAIRKETKDGISRLTPGTEVKLTRPGIYRTPIGEMALDAHNLTNEIGVARAAWTADQTKQAR